MGVCVLYPRCCEHIFTGSNHDTLLNYEHYGLLGFFATACPMVMYGPSPWLCIVSSFR